MFCCLWRRTRCSRYRLWRLPSTRAKPSLALELRRCCCSSSEFTTPGTASSTMYLSTCGNEQGSRRAQAPARRIAALTGTPRTAGGDASIENGNNGFVLSEELTVLRDQVRRIIRDEIIPIESRLDPTRPKFQR